MNPDEEVGEQDVGDEEVVDEGVVDEEEDGENVVEADVVDVVDILCFAFAQKGFF